MLRSRLSSCQACTMHHGAGGSSAADAETACRGRTIRRAFALTARRVVLSRGLFRREGARYTVKADRRCANSTALRPLGRCMIEAV